MEVAVPARGYPTDDDIGAGHLSVGRYAEADPSRGADVHGKVNCSGRGAEVPVERIVLIQIVEEYFLERVLGAEALSESPSRSNTQKKRYKHLHRHQFK